MNNLSKLQVNREPSVLKVYTHPKNFCAYTPIDFKEIKLQAETLSDIITSRLDLLTDILLEYETYEVATDEVSRTLDFLNSISENEEYFKLRIGAIATFLPRNQPLYAFVCFVIVPSFMASEVHFRIPHSMRNFLPKLLDTLDIFVLFPNLFVSKKERLEFLKERSAILLNPLNNESRPVTDVVIFTGTSLHADQLRRVFDKKTLFISNGSGHNPIVISQEADISQAVEAVLSLTLYNQGQDCAAPNAILVNQVVYDQFMNCLHTEFLKIKIGPYKDRSCRVGPISDPNDLKTVQSILVDNRKWLDAKTPGNIRTIDAIVEPTIICKPLVEGGNYDEFFSPILFIQKYINDEDLALYFENSRYSLNAMYVTLYGKSNYVKDMIGKTIDGKILHHKDTFLHDEHLHAQGVERGTQPYGGYGYAASSISILGKVTPMPTLPQRDIFEQVAKPLLESKKYEMYKEEISEFTNKEEKNIEKILRLKPSKNNEEDLSTSKDKIYLDLDCFKNNSIRFVKVEENNTCHVLSGPNIDYISMLSEDDLKLIRSLKVLLDKKSEIQFKEFSSELFEIPKKSEFSDEINKERQLNFFKNIYQLLSMEDRGPRLAPFLWELKNSDIDKLLDV